MAQQEQNSTSSSDDAGGLVIMAGVAGLGLVGWLGSRRTWLYGQGVLESPDEWTPTPLGIAVLVGLAAVIVGFIVTLLSGVFYRSTLRRPDGAVKPPLASRAAVVTLAVAVVTVLLVLAASISWPLAILGIIAVVAVAVLLVRALTGPAMKAQLVRGAARHANSYAGHSGTGNRTGFIKARGWTGGRLNPVPEELTCRVGDAFDYRGGQADVLAREVSQYIADLREQSIIYDVEATSRSARTVTLRKVS